MNASFYDLLKYANTGIVSPSMTYFDRMRASTLMGGAVQTLTGIPPLSFTGNGKPLISLSMLGNGKQTGTPSPDNIIMPTFCGKLVGADWTIPITCAGQTVPVYLGQTPTVRRVKKLVLTGEETFIAATYSTHYRCRTNILPKAIQNSTTSVLSTHYVPAAGARDGVITLTTDGGTVFFTDDTNAVTVEAFKSYLAAQYAAGTPVTVWYVLAEPETGIVNEPLAKIGDYADELHSTDAGVIIPTANGDNTLTVDTDLQPSSMTITGHIE